MNLNIIIPVYNEKNTIEIIVDKVLQYKELSSKMIIVDDGSTDGTQDILDNLKIKHPDRIKILNHETNKVVLLLINPNKKVKRYKTI